MSPCDKKKQPLCQCIQCLRRWRLENNLPEPEPEVEEPSGCAEDEVPGNEEMYFLPGIFMPKVPVGQVDQPPSQPKPPVNSPAVPVGHPIHDEIVKIGPLAGMQVLQNGQGIILRDTLGRGYLLTADELRWLLRRAFGGD